MDHKDKEKAWTKEDESKPVDDLEEIQHKVTPEREKEKEMQDILLTQHISRPSPIFPQRP